MEIWRDIPGYGGYYQASNMGRIKSLSRKNSVKERILKPGITIWGYFYVVLSKNGKCKTFNVHRLVLFTFEGYSNLQCNHKNCIKTDNRIENLEYITCKQNIRHARKNGLYQDEKKVDQFTKEGNPINTFSSMMDAERELGIHHPNISACCLNKRNTAGGFRWQFNDEFIN